MVSQIDYSKVIICLLMVFMGGRCSTSPNASLSSEYLRSLKDLRKSVYSAMDNKVKKVSENGRTYYSDYHKPGMDLNMSINNQKERAMLAITILGDRRPYQVAVLYKVDRLKGGKFHFDRYDKKIAQAYLDKIDEYLAGRPEERDVIDDFRPY